jgi:hypothetical protein
MLHIPITIRIKPKWAKICLCVGKSIGFRENCICPVYPFHAVGLLQALLQPHHGLNIWKMTALS